MKNARLLLLCLFFTVLAVSICAAAEPNAIRNKLARNTPVQGIPCAKGDAWFYPDGSLDQCTISSLTTIGGFSIPRGAVVELWPTGTAHFVTLPHNAVLAGYHVLGREFLGSSAGMAIAFYPSGKLRSIYLVSNQTIQGVPCRGGNKWDLFTDPGNDSDHVEFYEDGQLRSCQLASDHAGSRGGQRLYLTDTTLTIPAKPPDPRTGGAQ